MPGKILAIGAHSLLGEDVCRVLREDFPLETHSRKDLDLTNLPELEHLIESADFDTVLYAAGLTDPEACEEEKEKAFFLNSEIPAKIARLLQRRRPQARLLYFSDVMVFDGGKDSGYKEEDIARPGSVYGKSKLQGENEIIEGHDNFIIVRTSWVFGKKMKGIFKKLLEIYDRGPELKVVENFTGNPTYARDVGIFVRELLRKNSRGIYHLASAGCCSWYDYSREFIRLMRQEDELHKVIPIRSDGSHLKSSRPANSCLDCTKAEKLGISFPPWQDALARFVSEVFHP